jgi:hypothetical protein
MSSMTGTPVLGMSESELRHRLEEELVRAMRVEGGAPTIHAVAHSIARILEEDHLRIEEQLTRAGVVLDEAADPRIQESER